MFGRKLIIIYVAIIATCLWSDTVEAAATMDVKVTVLDEETAARPGYKSMSTIDTRELKDSEIFDIRVDTLPKNCQNVIMPSNCIEATACTERSGYYYIQMKGVNDNEPFLVECDVHTDDGVWTVVQRRQDGSVDFYRTWDNYQDGFGDIDGEFFIGLDKLHALTNNQGTQELLILMEYSKDDKDIQKEYAHYDSFAIGDDSQNYRLNRIGKYSGTAGDSLQEHINCEFSTKDEDNDNNPSKNCAQLSMGAWWYNNCHQSNLNGKYKEKTSTQGVNWFTFTGHTASLKYVKMMLRRRLY